MSDDNEQTKDERSKLITPEPDQPESNEADWEPLDPKPTKE